jgi:tetratricopeptide (TPR) repeat protein
MPFFEKAVKIFPLFAEAHFNLGMSARKTGDVPKAVKAYRAAIRCCQDDSIVKMAQEELQFLESILLKDSSFPTLDAYLANAQLFDQAFQCLVDRQFEQAVEKFQRVLAQNPAHVQSYGNMALAHAGLGRKSAAMACIDRALELDPHYGPALMNRRNVVRMREGEPLDVAAIREVHYYADKLNHNSV